MDQKSEKRQTSAPLPRMELRCPPQDFLGEEASPIYQYRKEYSAKFKALQEMEEAVEVNYGSFDSDMRALYNTYESVLTEYENEILYHFWALGMIAAVSESYEPGIALKDNSVLLRRIKEPEIPNLEKREHEAQVLRTIIARHLSPNEQRKILENYELTIQESWELRYYALINGYEWTLYILKELGYTEKEENIKWLYQLLN